MNDANDVKKEVILDLFNKVSKLDYRWYNASVALEFEGCLKTLAPLRRGIVATDVSIDVEGYRSQVLVGKWFKARYVGEQKVYVETKIRRRGWFWLKPIEILMIIRSDGERIAEFVRRPIKDAFCEIVGLARKIKLLEEKVYTLKLDAPCELKVKYYRRRKVIPDYYVFDVVNFRNVLPYVLTLEFDGKKRNILIDPSEMIYINDEAVRVIERCIDVAVKEFREVSEHNKNVLREMKKVVMPYEISTVVRG